MWAPSSVVMAEINASAATWASTSGGRRSEIFAVVKGRSTLPPSRTGGHAVHARHLERGRPGPGDRADRPGVSPMRAEPVDGGQRVVGELLRRCG